MLETIVAQATPPGRGGIGILRISGPQAGNVALVVVGRCPQARCAEYRRFYDSDGSVLDQGIVLFFPQPHSFTGEDVLELHGHGGPVLLDLLLQRILQIPGLRTAKPGEFSERAFLNNKLDLAQAEAIADLIEASSAQSARCAMRSLQGVFSQKIQQLVAAITQLRTYVESALDFPDEEIDWYSEEKITADLAVIVATLAGIQLQANQGKIMRDGIKVVIAGRPNAGKSTLMNSLTGCPTAIVTAIAGTTRDVLRESIHLDGIPLQLVDTAGLREASNEIERLGIDRAWLEIAQADHLLLVVDSTSQIEDEHPFAWPTLRQHFPDNLAVTIIHNKIDLTQEMAGLDETHAYPLLRLSAATGEGMTLLRNHLKSAVGWQKNIEGEFLARRRHLTALKQTAVYLQQAQTQLPSVTGTIGGELLAESLRLAQQSLDEITGRFTADDLLGEIFSHFCIGK